MIRGIPKEGWKRKRRTSTPTDSATVMIRGIPKEGWKREMAREVWRLRQERDDQRNP
jgi:hypothetical protein